MFTLLKTEGHARRGVFETVHGTIQTPFFMNVGTAAAIKGGISSIDLADQLKCQIELCNTYHLHLAALGDKIVRQNGWATPVYELAQADSDRQRRFPGIFSGKAAAHQRRGRIFSVSY